MNGSTPTLDVQELLRHLDWVRSLARELVRDAHAAEDVAQETFRLALERPALSGENPRGWLGTIARHVAVSFGRVRTRRGERERVAARAEPQPSTAELAGDAELARALAEAVLELDEPYRSAIVLRHYRGESIERIARITGVKPNSVRSRLARGLELLRGKLDRSRGGRAAWMSALLPLAGEAARTTLPIASAKVWIATAVLLVLGLIGVRAVVGRGADERSHASETVLESPGRASSRTTVALEELDPDDVGNDSARAIAATARASAGDLGVLELDVREPDGGAAAGIAYVVFCERRGDRLMARGVTDERGRATCRDLPEDVYLVRTERRGDAAAGFRGVWLAKGATKRVELALTRGGAVRGRVVDDRGVARAGIEITAPSGPGAWQHITGLEAKAPVVVAVTDDEGRFRVEHLRAFAKGVWIVDGEERPEQRFDAQLTARDPLFGAWSTVHFDAATAEGEEEQLPDVVLPRAGELAGIVVDEHGTPIVGALVSAEPMRFAEVTGGGRAPTPEFRPGAPGFALRAGEALTDARGAFAVACPSWAYASSFVAVTPEGARAEVPHPPVAPGTGLRDLRVVVARGELVEVEIVDAGGAPIRIVSPRVPSERVVLYGRHRITSAFEEVGLRFDFEDGGAHATRVAPDPDGRVRVALGGDPRDVRAVEVAAPGFTTRVVELPAGVEPGHSVRVELDALETVRVALAWQDGAWPAALESVSVHACLLQETRSIRGVHVECCGLGSSVGRERAHADEPLELPVATREPYFLHVAGRGAEGALGPQRFGPFAPGPDVHDLVLDGDLVPYTRSKPVPEHAPPVRGASERRASIRVRAVDAVDGRELDWRLEARVPGTEWGAIGSWSAISAPDAYPTLSAGTWEFRITANRHRTLALGTRAVEVGGALDLGTQRLEPYLVLRGRFVLADGGPWGEGASVSADHTWGAVDAEGRFELAGEFDDDVVLVVKEPPAPARAALGPLRRAANSPVLGVSWVPVAGWKPEEERVLDAPVFRPVVVRVTGYPPEHRAATLAVLVFGAGDAGEREFWGVEDPTAADRTFRFRLAPGSYRLEALSPLHPLPERAIDVPAGDGNEEPFVVELTAR